jgi:HEAT repeat protein
MERRLRIQSAKDRKDEEYLLRALQDPDDRVLAAKLLGELGAVDATEALLRLLDAADPHVRAEGAAVLGRLGAKTALPRLREVAANDDEGSSVPGPSARSPIWRI